ncbi:hypothetical protein KAFR_0A07080 [Kazachstania africana CBS 2517]|uniref:MoaB/Mog domain-containing protein n=1 Tax=Kazachstania africana (strain ATCC 22294 / BCRC 22015 / CBS 2517 / CECT 1963 / NBRC 1671 / NRRL Y-8276) TaxID=1071382 RepID=H2AP42_KAZAF|nr:hypothetical protein KAFR_0A07080 [Kazachstania africana CBS 2517]CCF56142.1 hypothetical protein KAFR_0A07080 [Kazachstania africana CBS 2517]
MSKISAACIIIGDEVLNGKIVDTNSRFFAKLCFSLGIKLREVVVIGDDESQIIETVRRLWKQHQFIVTSGGIGSTHDDITYECLAKSFNLPAELNEECKKRMQEKSNPEGRLNVQQLKDFYKMATLPAGHTVKNYYPCDDLWVPVCSIKEQVFILPGIPQLFERLLECMLPVIKKIFEVKEKDAEYIRFFVKTTFTESQISHQLRMYQDEASKVSAEIKIGSYPHFGLGFNTVSILGEKKDEDYLTKIRDRAIKDLQGEELPAELEDAFSNERK